MVNRVRRPLVVTLVGLAVAAAPSVSGAGQTELSAEQVELRDAVTDRFEVVPLTDGLGLSPRDSASGVRMIEVGATAIAIDGEPVSGLELRERLGEDADLILRLTYLETPTRLALFGVQSVDPEVTAAAPPPPPPPAPPAPPAPIRPAEPDAPESTRRARRTTMSDVFRLGGSLTVDADERVRGDIVVIGGPLTVNGEVTGEIVLIGGPARFGPESYVRGEVTIVGGPISRSPTAEFRRGINQVGIGNFDFLGDMDGWFAGVPFRAGFNPRMFQVWDLAGTLVRLVLLALIACVVVFVARGSVERIADRSAAEPLKAGFVGFLAQVLFVPLLVIGILLLVISIVGIPLLVLLPFVFIAMLFVLLVGFTGVVQGVGRWFGGRMGRVSQPPYLSVWVGIAIILIPTLAGEALDLAGGMFGFFALMLAMTGLFVEYAVWTTGLGAVILNRFGGPLPQPAGGAIPPPAGTPPSEPPPAPLDEGPPPDLPADDTPPLDRS